MRLIAAEGSRRSVGVGACPGGGRMATSAPASTAATSWGMSDGRVLEVAVHRDHDLAAGARDAGVHRRVLAVVAIERHHPQARVGVVQVARAARTSQSVDPSSTKITSPGMPAPSSDATIPW